MTLQELARLSGKSVSTVSKAFSGSSEIPKETKEEIFEIAKQLGCFEKYYKGPRERRMVAILVPESESEFYGREIGLLERELNRRGADTVIALTRFDPECEARLFSELAYRLKVDGVILSGHGNLIKNPDEVPLVRISYEDNKAITDINADSIYVNRMDAMFELISTIKKYGHKRVGFIGGRLTRVTFDFFKSAMRREGLAVLDKYIEISKSERFAEAGEIGMKNMINRGDIPDVIVAAYDQIAFGAMGYAQKSGLRIPEDISFAGIDDLSVARYVNPPLTSIHTHLEEICDKVVDLVFKRIDNRHYRGRTEIVIPATVVLRESLQKCELSETDDDAD